MTVVPPPQRPRRLSRVALIVIIGFGVLSLLVVVGIVGLLVWLNHRFERNVAYEVSGTVQSVTINYRSDDQDQTERRVENVSLPWAAGFHTKFMTANARVIAAANAGDQGTLTCTLKIDGQVVATQTSKDGAVVCVEPDR
ncbi:MmpS family transport accessory protein [Kribbella sp. NPDC051952]|uniref:MmpS family transport accessory protein n=1 Tax=Kribbella sp. NPDC051952 TaxID=3154851 RepID=UPI003444CB52